MALNIGMTFDSAWLRHSDLVALNRRNNHRGLLHRYLQVGKKYKICRLTVDLCDYQYIL